MDMLNLCLQTRQFQFREKHYELVDGLAMGSPGSPPVANIFMADFETEALESFEGDLPREWSPQGVVSVCG